MQGSYETGMCYYLKIKVPVMLNRIIVFMFASLFISACINSQKAPVSSKKEILYIYSDGTMEFKGRKMNEDEVVIYDDGFGGERAAVLLRLPYREDVYRDSITVERKLVPIKRVQ